MALDVERVREIAERVAASSGTRSGRVEFRGGGKARMLRVFLDKPAAGADPLAGVTHEDCANFSREFGTILDVEDVMPGFVHAGSFVAGAGPEVDKAGGFRRASPAAA
jgi:ribosome maturation factor RimP